MPRFDDEGRHVRTPAQLQVAACADERIDQRLLADRAREAIDRLPDSYREALVLRDLEELETAEVAHTDPASALRHSS